MQSAAMATGATSNGGVTGAATIQHAAATATAIQCAAGTTSIPSGVGGTIGIVRVIGHGNPEWYSWNRNLIKISGYCIDLFDRAWNVT